VKTANTINRIFFFILQLSLLIKKRGKSTKKYS